MRERERGEMVHMLAETRFSQQLYMFKGCLSMYMSVVVYVHL